MRRNLRSVINQVGVRRLPRDGDGGEYHDDAQQHEENGSSDGQLGQVGISPFVPVMADGRTFVPRQGNNSYIFPGVGLGVIVSRARRVTDDMFMTAATTLAGMVEESDLAQGSLYPPLAHIREVSAAIAAAVAESAYAGGLAGKPRPADVLADVRSQMYDPRYSSYV